MYYVFLNINKVENLSQKGKNLLTTSKQMGYLEFLRRVCPHRIESSLTLTSLIHKFSEKFALSRIETQSILKSFIDEDILQIGYDDGVKLNILANQTREAIYSLISNYPGIYISIIRSHLELGTHQTLWHLGFLMKFEYIKEFIIANVKAYSEPGIPFNRILLGFILFKNSLRSFLKILHQYPDGISVSDLLKKTKKARSSLTYMLKNLTKLHIITKPEKNSSIYKLNFEYQTIFHEVLHNFQEIFAKDLHS